MKGFDIFLNVFGNITIFTVAEIIVAAIFIFVCYKKIKKHLVEQHQAEVRRGEELQEALAGVRKYPEYRQQSIEIQRKLESEISEQRRTQDEIIAKLNRMEEATRRREEITQRRERNKIRDTLLQNHRYYTSKESNPSQSWTRMEAEAFWELFREYEEAGGDGYMHTDVLPDMKLLNVVEVGRK